MSELNPRCRCRHAGGSPTRPSGSDKLAGLRLPCMPPSSPAASEGVGNSTNAPNSRKREFCLFLERGGACAASLWILAFESPLSRRVWAKRLGDFGEYCLSPKGELRSRPIVLFKLGEPKAGEAGRAFFGYFLCTSKESNALPGAPGQLPNEHVQPDPLGKAADNNRIPTYALARSRPWLQAAKASPPPTSSPSPSPARTAGRAPRRRPCTQPHSTCRRYGR